MDIDVKKLIGGNISKIRHSKKLNGPDIERITNGVISVSRLSNYETGLREPDLDTIILLAKAMKTRVLDILEGIVEKADSKPETQPTLKPDRQDIHIDIEALPPGRMDDVRLMLELIKQRKPADVIHVKSQKKKQKKK